jgi:two-component system sensor histidine kinase UhpB
MSQLFSFKTITALLFAVFLAEMMMLGRIYGDTHSETRREAQLVEQILQEKLRHLETAIADQADFDYQHAFALHNLRALEKLDITFVGDDGSILDSNHPQSHQRAWWSSLLGWLIDKHLGLMSVIYPVTIAGQHVGDLIITNNLVHELGEVTTQAIEILLPWFLLFVLSSLLLLRLFSYLLDAIEPLLPAQSAHSPKGRHFVLRSLVNPRRLPIKLITAVGALNTHFAQQKRQVITAREAERKRLAAELHDELGQHLTAVRMEIDRLSRQEQTHIKSSLTALKTHSERMTEIVRSNLEQLNPPDLAAHGLRYCLDNLINDWQRRHTQHQLSFSMHCHPRLLDSQSQLIVYRLIQECLTNISRHAGKQVSVEISLRREADMVQIAVADNGKGCDLDAKQSGFGLPGMKQRVKALSGELTIISQPMQGMQVLAALPVGWKQ